MHVHGGVSGCVQISRGVYKQVSECKSAEVRAQMETPAASAGCVRGDVCLEGRHEERLCAWKQRAGERRWEQAV